jgi:hypothetical protein
LLDAYRAAHSQRRSLSLLHRAMSADPAPGRVACALLRLLEDSTWFEENDAGVRTSTLQVRRVAAAKLHEVLGLGALDAASLLAPTRMDERVGRTGSHAQSSIDRSAVRPTLRSRRGRAQRRLW